MGCEGEEERRAREGELFYVGDNYENIRFAAFSNESNTVDTVANITSVTNYPFEYYILRDDGRIYIY